MQFRQGFLDSHNAATSKQLRVLPGNYESLTLRFVIDQAAAQTVTPADLGEVKLTYHNKQKQLWNFTELLYLNNLKYGAVENVNAGAGGVYTVSFRIPLVHWGDSESSFYVANDTDMRVEWQPSSGLAAKVDSIQMRLLGKQRFGKTTHLLTFGRVDIAMVVGNTRPERLTDHNIASVFLEYNTNIGHVDMSVNGQDVVQNQEIVELLNESLLHNRIETYATSGAYAEIDLLGAPYNNVNPATLPRIFNNDVQVRLTGDVADTISVFYVGFDFQGQESAISEVRAQQALDKILGDKAASGGSAALAVYSAAISNKRLSQE